MSTLHHELRSLRRSSAWTGARASVRIRAERHPVATFFLFTFAFSWLLWTAPALGLRGPLGTVLLFTGVFGPAFAAAAVTHLTGGSLRAWLRELVRVRAAPRWYAAIIGFPVTLVAATTALFVLTGGALETSLLGERLAAYLPLLIVWTLAGAGEEPGWRGFALWNRTRNVWLAILLHGSLTAAIGAFLLLPAEEQVGGTYAHLQLLTVVVLAVAVLGLVRATHGRLGLEPAAAGQGRGTGPRLPVSVPRTGVHGRLELLWRDRWLGAAAAVGLAAGAAAILAPLMPRGPLTAAQGLATMLAGLLVGVGAGLSTRSRWAMLVAPLSFVAVFELARLGVDGPTVDGLDASMYGLIALGVGRGVHGVLALLPMLLGVAIGAGAARRVAGRRAVSGWARAGLYGRRGAAALVALALLALAVAIARPATTDPILGPSGEPLAGSIAELTRVPIGGHDLAMMIRGHSIESPVLLFLAGGPGGTELGAMRRHLEALERDFVVVTWDQRGTGKSYGALDPISTLTVDRAVADAIEVTNYLRERFGRERIYLVGQSWGTILGVQAVRQQPELYEAFVGIGQMVSPSETDRIFYEDTLAWARASGRDGLVATLAALGPPPYERMLDYATLLAYEKDVYPYDRSRNAEGAGQMGENIFVEEYTLLEQIHVFGALFDTFSVLYPQLRHVDFRTDARELGVPVYLVQGRHEARGRAEPAREWLEQLRAPSKQMLVLDTSGHRPLFEQPDRFHEVMTRIVLAETQPGR
jgi:proline iminopeptidase